MIIGGKDVRCSRRKDQRVKMTRRKSDKTRRAGTSEVSAMCLEFESIDLRGDAHPLGAIPDSVRLKVKRHIAAVMRPPPTQSIRLSASLVAGRSAGTTK